MRKGETMQNKGFIAMVQIAQTTEPWPVYSSSVATTIKFTLQAVNSGRNRLLLFPPCISSSYVVQHVIDACLSTGE